MELVNKIGGFGIFQFDSKEVALLERMRALADHEYRYTLGCEKYQQTQEFSSLTRDLFPEVPLQSRYSVYNPREKSHHYQPFAPYHELGINSQFPRETIKNEYGYNQSRLAILFSDLAEQNQYPVSMALMEFYTPSIVDDLVKIFGRRETPVLEGLAHLPIKRRETDLDRAYGIAEVHRLGAVLRLYERANTLLNNIEGIMGVSEKELGILRRDSLAHESLVIRDLSRERYQKELHRLVNY